jgi:hypothetical protein
MPGLEPQIHHVFAGGHCLSFPIFKSAFLTLTHLLTLWQEPRELWKVFSTTGTLLALSE